MIIFDSKKYFTITCFIFACSCCVPICIDDMHDESPVGLSSTANPRPRRNHPTACPGRQVDPSEAAPLSFKPIDMILLTMTNFTVSSPTWRFTIQFSTHT